VLSRRWPQCLRIVVVPGTVTAEAKNYLTDEYFKDVAAGEGFAQLLGDEVANKLRIDGKREVRHTGEAVHALGDDNARTRAVADAMLAHARQWMAHDPGYDDPALHGLAPDPGIVPFELRRGFDAIVVVGGRSKYETHHETYHRYAEIVARNLVAYPFFVFSPLVPFAMPAGLALIMQGQGGYWQSAPNVSYFQIAIFDGKTGRLLYANDWFQTEPIVQSDDYEKVANGLLKKLLKVEPEDEAPLGKPPESWN
jgi:hypothetical protein